MVMESKKESHNVLIPLKPKQTSDELYDRLGFEQSPGSQFWDEVKAILDGCEEDISWQKAINIVQVNMIIEYCHNKEIDPILYLMETVYQQFVSTHQNDEELLPSFKREIAKLVEKLLDIADEEAKNNQSISKYSGVIESIENRNVRRSLLHISAESNQFDIAKELVKRYNELLYMTTLAPGCDKYYPIELALNNKHDKLSAMLIDSMDNSFVRTCFLTRDDNNTDEYDECHTYNLKDFINNKNMTETVIAFLDCFIDPCWPYIPRMENEEIDRKAWKNWQDVPDLRPTRYQFHYKYLDGDLHGYAPNDSNFDYSQFSPLHLLVLSAHDKKCIRHPVVRMLVRTKWDTFARHLLGLYGFGYIFFIISLAVAGVLGASQYNDGPLKYETGAEYVRLVFEIIALALTVVHLMMEIADMLKEKNTYFKSFYNYRDLCGFLGIFVVLGLRIGDHKSQWAVASVVFMVNVFGVFRYAYLWKTGGLYTNTFISIMSSDLPKFAAVFIVLFVQYTGGLYFALTAADSVDLAGGLTGIILKEFRAVTEMNPFEDSYDKYHALLIVLILINMLSIIVVLMNVLIAQLNNRYADAQKEAVQQFDLDKALMVTRVESSRFKLFSLRSKYYIEDAYVNDTALVQEILKDWHKTTK